MLFYLLNSFSILQRQQEKEKPGENRAWVGKLVGIIIS
tara:strand:+ start:786 stop:899 length:114 start_codon:yes stop_codon:yes gene_type:complete